MGYPVAACRGHRGGLRPLLLDHFTGANGTGLALHPMDRGTGWTVLDGSFDLFGGRARNTGGVGAAGGGAYAVADAGRADVTASVVVRMVAATVVGVVFRVADLNNLWLARLGFDNGLTTYERVAGTYTLRGGPTAVTIAAGQDYQLRVSCRGPLVVAAIAGQGQCSYGAMATGLAATKFGFVSTTNGDLFDDFRVNA